MSSIHKKVILTSKYLKFISPHTQSFMNETVLQRLSQVEFLSSHIKQTYMHVFCWKYNIAAVTLQLNLF